MTFSPDNPSNEYGNASIITTNGENAISGSSWYCTQKGGTDELSYCVTLELNSLNSGLSIYGINITIDASSSSSQLDFFVTFASNNKFLSVAFDWDGGLTLGSASGGVLTAPECGTDSGIYSVSSADNADANSTIFDLVDGVSLFGGGSSNSDFRDANRWW